MGRFGTGPCGCFGLTLEQGSQIFAIFDIITGVVLFVAFFVIFLIGYFGDMGAYPSEQFNIPREVVITFTILGYYNATTGLFLYFSAGYRKRVGCIAWIILSFPLMFVDFIKIYQGYVVYKLNKEIKHGKVEKLNKEDAKEEDEDDIIDNKKK